MATATDTTIRPTLTPALARSAGWDAGNRSMRAAGRTAWSEADFDAAAQTCARLMEAVQPG